MAQQSSMAFFYRPSTPKLINWLTRSPLTIYAGAGVSVDRTGLDWAGLIGTLLKEVTIDLADEVPETERPQHAEVIVRHLLKNWGPARCGTVVAKSYDYPARGHERMISLLRNNLYPRSSWTRGRLLGALADFALVRSLHGRATTFVTTNYDVGLEHELEERILAKELRNPPKILPIEVTDEYRLRPDPRRWSSTRAIRIYYLHGRVDREHGREQPVLPVVGEMEYSRRSSACQQVIGQAARYTNIAIVGSSLTDTPLIDALLAAEPPSRDGLQRIVVLSKQSSEWRIADDSGDTQLDDSLDLVAKRRIEELGLVAHYVDFFGQVGQVFHEARIQMEVPETRSYTERLDTWWSEWKQAVLSSDPDPIDGVTAPQRRHHSEVRSRLQLLRAALQTDSAGSGALRLQVWVRWDPSEEHREFRLWASSNGPISDLSAMPRHRIQWSSTSPVVRAFCEGRPCLFGPLPGSRWSGGTVATPIWRDGGDAIPLGVVVLQSDAVKLSHEKLVAGRSSDPLQLYDWAPRIDQETREFIKSTLRVLGRAILTPGSGRPVTADPPAS